MLRNTQSSLLGKNSALSKMLCCDVVEIFLHLQFWPLAWLGVRYQHSNALLVFNDFSKTSLLQM